MSDNKKRASVQLPDRYQTEAGLIDAADNETNHVVTYNAVTTLAMAVGACGIAVMVVATNLRKNDLYNFSVFLFQLFEYNQVVVYACAGAFGSGIATFFLALLLGYAALLNMRKLMIVLTVFVLVVSVAMLCVGVITQSGIDSTLEQIRNAAGTVPSAPGSTPFKVIHLLLATFNTCCAVNGWSRENAPGYDPLTPNKYAYGPPYLGPAPEIYYVPACVVINDTGIPTSSRNWEKKGNENLQCYRDQETYRRYNVTAQANKDKLCDVLSKTTVDIAGLDVPGTKIDFSAVLFKGKTLLKIVGESRDPSYGCAGGFSLGFMALLVLWGDQTVKPLTTVCTACGAIQISLLLIAFVFGIVSRETEKAGTMSSAGAYDRYLAEVQNQTNARVESVVTGREGSVRNSVDSKASSLHSAAYGNQYGGGQVPYAAYAAPVPGVNTNFNVDDKI